jgi:hypothetical protein
MDRGSVHIKLEKALNTLGKAKVSVRFDSNDVVKIEVISNISIIALTENEVSLGIKENGSSNIIVSNGEGFAAQPPLS